MLDGAELDSLVAAGNGLANPISARSMHELFSAHARRVPANRL